MAERDAEMRARWKRYALEIQAVYEAMAALVEEGAMPSEMRSHSAILVFDGAVDKLIAKAEESSV